MAQNEVFPENSPLRMAVASTVTSGDPCLVGTGMAGVALTDYDSGDGKATIAFEGVYDLPTHGVDDAGSVAIAVGDPLYLLAGDAFLSRKASGTLMGYALETVGSGSTTAVINVRLSGSQGRSGGYGQGMFISAETTGTGSSQSVAHTLGVAPAQVLVVLTEFTSNLSIDVAEGTHTTSNVVVTVTSGAKFKVFALR